MVRVKDPTKQGAIVASTSIGSSSVGEWIVFMRSNAMEIHTLWGARSNVQISRSLRKSCYLNICRSQDCSE